MGERNTRRCRLYTPNAPHTLGYGHATGHHPEAFDGGAREREHLAPNEDTIPLWRPFPQQLTTVVWPRQANSQGLGAYTIPDRSALGSWHILPNHSGQIPQPDATFVVFLIYKIHSARRRRSRYLDHTLHIAPTQTPTTTLHCIPPPAALLRHRLCDNLPYNLPHPAKTRPDFTHQYGGLGVLGIVGSAPSAFWAEASELAITIYSHRGSSRTRRIASQCWASLQRAKIALAELDNAITRSLQAGLRENSLSEYVSAKTIPKKHRSAYYLSRSSRVLPFPS
ncbi:hypothetical protein F5Y12DRAFT_709295 [Xylaria sp. FL1777]|nr:hypothetical protein F5Y12DRAFT_709295 [Xylaria sp. FL1777]